VVCYQAIVGGSSVIGSGSVGLLQEAASVTLALIFLGLVMGFVGLTVYLRRSSSNAGSGRLRNFVNRISIIISNKRSMRLFVLASVAYGLFFAIISSTLVFQPGVVFSETYGVKVPSAVPVLCCGSIGQMPQLVIYVTQQFAILIVPVNLVLLFVVSWLIGLNAVIADFVYSNRAVAMGTRWAGGLGAIIGLFTVCPTCASLFFLTMLGLSGAATLALGVSAYQGVFIAVAIPILMINPIFTLSRTDRATCVVRNSQD
jgi:hypothetical protein